MVSIGHKLKEARIQRKLTIEEVAEATKIKPQFLEAIEKEEYSKLPSPAYAQGFVRNYADFLGLPKVQTTALFKRDYDEKKVSKVISDRMYRQQNYSGTRINLRVIVIVSFVAFFLFAFIYSQVKSTYISPTVSITSPKEGSVVQTVVEVVGKTDNNAIVTVNNEPVFVQQSGEFKKTITLFPGQVTITVKAKNRSGKETVIERKVIVKQ